MSKLEELEIKKMYDYLTGTQFKQRVNQAKGASNRYVKPCGAWGKTHIGRRTNNE